MARSISSTIHPSLQFGYKQARHGSSSTKQDVGIILLRAAWSGLSSFRLALYWTLTLDTTSDVKAAIEVPVQLEA